jgi:hypothetical protein
MLSPEFNFAHIGLKSLNQTKIEITFVEREVLTAVIMKSSVFWDMMPCSPLKVNRHFGGTYHLYLKG